MTDYTPTTEEVRESFASGVNFESRTPFLSGRKQFDRWLAAHDAEVRQGGDYHEGFEEGLKVGRAEVRAGVVAEEPEWETDRVEEARIHYRYGVNSGTLAAWNTPESIAVAIEDHERRTMGPIGVHRIDVRTKITRTSPWVPVKQEGAEQ